MFNKKTIKINKEHYEMLTRTSDRYQQDRREYMRKYYETLKEKANLERENGYLNALFDKEADTDVIKYNGKLYKIVSTIHSIDVGIEETLNISLVPVREVN